MATHCTTHLIKASEVEVETSNRVMVNLRSGPAGDLTVVTLSDCTDGPVGVVDLLCRAVEALAAADLTDDELRAVHERTRTAYMDVVEPAWKARQRANLAAAYPDDHPGWDALADAVLGSDDTAGVVA
jgi:hypothetical protein